MLQSDPTINERTEDYILKFNGNWSPECFGNPAAH